jgi:hypothetical protein
MRWNGWAVVLVCALACVLPHWSCKGRSIAVMPVSETKLDELSPTTRPAFAAGREALLGGRAADAQAIFAHLHQDDPRHMMYALWMQDAQREAARLAGRLPDPQGWWFEARQRGDVRAWLLAARAALDDATVSQIRSASIMSCRIESLSTNRVIDLPAAFAVATSTSLAARIALNTSSSSSLSANRE